MGNRRLYKIERFHTPGTSESERLKVTDLPSPERLRAGRSKSFPPDRLSPFSEKSVFSYCDTVSRGGGLVVILCDDEGKAMMTFAIFGVLIFFIMVGLPIAVSM